MGTFIPANSSLIQYSMMTGMSEEELKLEVLPEMVIRNPRLRESAEYQQLLDIYAGYYQQHGYLEPWVAYLVVQGEWVLGTGSFVAAPKNGTVEIAYWTFEQFQGQGVAGFCCGELIRIARAHAPEVRITAKTAPAEGPSTAILRKHGFRMAGVVQDHEIGDAWLWELAPISH